MIHKVILGCLILNLLHALALIESLFKVMQLHKASKYARKISSIVDMPFSDTYIAKNVLT